MKTREISRLHQQLMGSRIEKETNDPIEEMIRKQRELKDSQVSEEHKMNDRLIIMSIEASEEREKRLITSIEAMKKNKQRKLRDSPAKNEEQKMRDRLIAQSIEASEKRKKSIDAAIEKTFKVYKTLETAKEQK